MKKINLSIPKPCHENWDAMTPSEKGKFCTSCQKTVIDFTNMSDRQIAQFFKKPPSSVCGRVYNDQLNRNITIPKKRIPWVRYFFHFTWPAFVLFLKSCGVKEDMKGKIKLHSNLSGSDEKLPIATLGVMLTEIMPVDTTVNIVKEEHITKGEIIDDTAISARIDSVKMPIGTPEDTAVVYKPMDTVVVSAYSYGTTTGKIMTGGISVCRIGTDSSEEEGAEESTTDKEINFKVYPNPVRAGSMATISFEGSENFPERIQILSSSGQLISQVIQKEKKYTSITDVQVPSNVTAGIYFLQVIAKNKQVKTTKLIVVK